MYYIYFIFYFSSRYPVCGAFFDDRTPSTRFWIFGSSVCLLLWYILKKIFNNHNLRTEDNLAKGNQSAGNFQFHY